MRRINHDRDAFRDRHFGPVAEDLVGQSAEAHFISEVVLDRVQISVRATIPHDANDVIWPRAPKAFATPERARLLNGLLNEPSAFGPANLSTKIVRPEWSNR